MLEYDPTEKKHPAKVKTIGLCGGGVTDQKKDQGKKLFQEHLGRLYAALNSAGWLLAVSLIENEDLDWRDGRD